MKFIMYDHRENKIFSRTINAKNWKEAIEISKACDYELKGELIS